MKLKNLFAVAVLSLFFANGALAQDEGPSKRVNLHVNPLTWVVGFYSLGADVAVSEKFTLGGSVNVFDFPSEEFEENIEAEAKGFGIRGQYFFNRAFSHSWYLSGFYQTTKGEVDDTSTGEFADLKLNSLGFTGGYFWRWGLFNLQLGLGIQQNNVELTNSTLTAEDRQDIEDIDGASVTGDLRIGLAF